MLKKNNMMKKEKNFNKFATQSLRVEWDKEDQEKINNKKNLVTNFDYSLNK